MNPKEQGFLLLCSHLGDPERRILTVSQLRTLAKRMRSMERPEEDRQLLPEDLYRLGYGKDDAQRILSLLSERELLEYYLRRGKRAGCLPLPRINSAYPAVLREKLGPDCPGCLWAKGDLSILTRPAIALVGSRDLRPENRAFARSVGAAAARQGYVLVSGNARGADTAAQNGALEAGGAVISVVADSLEQQAPSQQVLYLSEDGYDLGFSAHRALSRNRVIHCLGKAVFIAQASLESGGTWDGTVRNLRHGWTQVFCYDDGSKAASQLICMGAEPIQAFSYLPPLLPEEQNLFSKAVP